MFSIAVFGFTAALAQLVLFREFLSIVTGNELSIAILLFHWLLLGGAGALLGGKLKGKPALLPVFHAAAALLPPLTLLSLRLLRNTVFTRGAEPGALSFFLFSLLLLAPFCILNGLFLPVANERLRILTKNNSAYAADTAGGLLGGLLFSLLLFCLTNSFQIFLLIGLLNAAILFQLRQRVVGGMVCILLSIPLLAGAERKSQEVLFPNLAYERTFPSKFSLVRLFRQTDGSPVLFSGTHVAYVQENALGAEELTHIPLLQLPESSRVLIISNGMTELAAEALKHHPVRVDYLDSDPDMLKADKALNLLKDNPRLYFIAEDARAYFDRTNERYDCILTAVSEPATLSLNRYFTAEFYHRLKSHLNDGGIAAFLLPGMPDCLSAEFIAILSGVRATLAQDFKQSLFFPGNMTIAMASDRTVNANLDSLLQTRPLKNKFMNRDYLKGFYTPFRFDQINTLPVSAEANHDFKPSLFLKFQKRFFSEFSFNTFFLLVPAGLVFLFFFFLPGRRGFTLFTTAFAATGGEIFLLTAFEIHFGTLYYAMSFLFASFLFGLSAGFLAGQKGCFRSARSADIALLIFLPFLLCVVYAGCKFLIIPLLVIIALLAGAQLAVLSKETPEHFAGLYGADLLGGALGALVMGTLLFPLFGPLGAIGILTGMKALSLLAGLKSDHRR